MDTLFRTKKSGRTSASSSNSHSTHLSSPTDLTGSVPYNQLPTSYALPVVGPSTLPYVRREGTISVNDVGAPSTNPNLGHDGQPFNLHGRPPIPPPSPRRSEKSRQSTRNSSTTDVSGRMSPDEEVLSPTFRGIHRSSSRQQQPMAEFGGPRYNSRDTDTMSIRTVSSIGSNRMVPVGDLGRYPSFATDPRGSISNRSTHTLVTPRSGPPHPSPSLTSYSSNIAGSRLSEEFSFTRPPDHEVDKLFEELLSSRNVDESTALSRSSASSQVNIAKTAASLSTDIKWQMVESDRRARWDAAKIKQRKEDESVRSGKAAKRGTAAVVVKNSPEWFLKKCLDGTLTADHVRTLSVSLRTQPYEYVQKSIRLTAAGCANSWHARARSFWPATCSATRPNRAEQWWTRI